MLKKLSYFYASLLELVDLSRKWFTAEINSNKEEGIKEKENFLRIDFFIKYISYNAREKGE